MKKHISISNILLGSILVMSLAACNREPADIGTVPEDYDLTAAINELPTQQSIKTQMDITDKEQKATTLERLNEAFGLAIGTKNEEKVAELLSQGVNPNQEVECPCYGECPCYYSSLCCALRNDSDNIVKLLLQAGANANDSCYDNGSTPLMEASNSASVPILKMLLEAGADINAKDKEGKTALLQTYAYYDDIFVGRKYSSHLCSQSSSSTWLIA